MTGHADAESPQAVRWRDIRGSWISRHVRMVDGDRVVYGRARDLKDYIRRLSLGRVPADEHASLFMCAVQSVGPSFTCDTQQDLFTLRARPA